MVKKTKVRRKKISDTTMLYVKEGYILLFHDTTRLMPQDRDCHRFGHAFYN